MKKLLQSRKRKNNLRTLHSFSYFRRGCVPFLTEILYINYKMFPPPQKKKKGMCPMVLFYTKKKTKNI